MLVYLMYMTYLPGSRHLKFGFITCPPLTIPLNSYEQTLRRFSHYFNNFTMQLVTCILQSICSIRAIVQGVIKFAILAIITLHSYYRNMWTFAELY